MATRFWVGGTGTWDGTSTTNWAATTGGASGASVPTTSDDVTFDANSGATATVTVQTATAQAKTITINKSDLTLTYSGVGSNVVGAMTLTIGTLNTNGQTHTWGSFNSSNANARTLTLGASTITVSDPGATTATPWNCTTSTNLTLSALSSTINLTGAGTPTAVKFDGGAKSWGTVHFSGSGQINAGTSGTSFVNFIADASGASNSLLMSTGGGYTVTGTWTLTGASAIQRYLTQTGTTGLQCTWTCAAVAFTNVDFTDTILAGAAAGSGGTSVGNGLGNSGITFTTSVTRYWVGHTANASVTSSWAATSGGASGASIPICHDSIIFDTNSFSANGQTATIDLVRPCADINYSAATNRTGCAILLTPGLVDVFGSWTGLPATTNVSVQGAVTLRFRGRGTHTISGMWASVTLPNPTIFSQGGTYTLQDDVQGSITLTSWIGNLTLQQGTLDLNGHNLNCRTFVSTGTFTRSLIFNGGSMTINSAGGVSWSVASTGLTISGLTGSIFSRVAATSGQTFAGAGLTYGTLYSTVSGATAGFSITGANSFADILITDSTSTKTITFPSAATTTIRSGKAFRNIRGRSGNLITVNASTPGSAAIIALPNGTAGDSDFLSVQDITTTTNTWYAGNNSTNVSGNTNVTFGSGPVVNNGNFFSMT